MAANAGGIRAGRAFVEIALDGLSRAKKDLGTLGASVRAVGASFFRAGAAAAIPFAASAKAFSDFESNMARVKAITNASGDEFDALGTLAKKLGADTVFSAAQAAQAMGNFAQAGFSVKQIMQAVGPTLDLAATAQIEIADAASIASKVMRGMGVDASQLGNVIDVMAKAATTANTDIIMLGDAFKFVGPIAKTAGISFEEITAAIQLLSNAGIQGEMAGTTLRGMILTLNAPSEKAAQTLQELGISVKDGKGNFRGLASVIGQLEKKLAGMGNSAKLEKLGAIFPDRQAAGAVELVAQGAERLADATKKLGNSSGTAARVAGTQMDTLRGTVDILMSSIEGIAIEIGAALSPAIRAWGTRLADVANTLAIVVKNNQALIVTVAKGVAGAVALGAAMYGAGVAIRGVAMGIGILSTVMRVTVATVGAINAAFRLFAVTVNIATAASATFAGLSAIMAALVSPVGLIVAGMAGLVAYLVQTGAAGEILASVSQRFSELKDAALAAFGGIADALKGGDLQLAGSILAASFKLASVQIFGDFSAIWPKIRVGAMDALGAIWSGMQSGFVSAIGAVHDAFTTFFGWIQKQWIDIFSFIGKAVNMATALVNPFFDRKAADAEISAGAEASKADVDKSTADALEARKPGRDAARDAIDRARREAEDARHAALDKEIGAPGEALAKAKADLQTLLDEAKKKANPEKIDETLGLDEYKPGGGGAKSLTPEGIDEGMKKAARTVSVKGSFDASGGLQGQFGIGDTVTDAVKNVEKENKKTNAKLDKLNRQVEMGGGLV